MSVAQGSYAWNSDLPNSLLENYFCGTINEQGILLVDHVGEILHRLERPTPKE
jgi:hypothetical protein